MRDQVSVAERSLLAQMLVHDQANSALEGVF